MVVGQGLAPGSSAVVLRWCLRSHISGVPGTSGDRGRGALATTAILHREKPQSLSIMLPNDWRISGRPIAEERLCYKAN